MLDVLRLLLSLNCVRLFVLRSMVFPSPVSATAWSEPTARLSVDWILFCVLLSVRVLLSLDESPPKLARQSDATPRRIS